MEMCKHLSARLEFHSTWAKELEDDVKEGELLAS